jgi:hypothetical protein
MERNSWSSVFSADVMEFVTLSVKFCNLIEQNEEESVTAFCYSLQKILGALYQKGLILSALELDNDDTVEEYVTEEQYDYIRSQISRLLGNKDDYLDTFVEDMKYSDRPILKTVSEDMADVYQALGNFVSSFQTELEEVMFAALSEAMRGFKDYWGGRLLSAMRALHEIVCNVDAEDEL